MDACASALGFYFFGYAFAYGDELTAEADVPVPGFAAGTLNGNPFIGKMYFAMDKMLPTTYQNWVFQWTVSLSHNVHKCTVVYNGCYYVTVGAVSLIYAAVANVQSHSVRACIATLYACVT